MKKFSSQQNYNYKIFPIDVTDWAQSNLINV